MASKKSNKEINVEQELKDLRKKHEKLKSDFQDLNQWKEDQVKRKEIYQFYTQDEKIYFWSLDFDSKKFGVKPPYSKEWSFGFKNIVNAIMQWTKFIDQSDLDLCISKAVDAFKNGYKPFEATLRTVKGEKTKHFLVHGQFLVNEAQEPYMIIGANIDITETMKAESKLKQRLEIEKIIAFISSLFVDVVNMDIFAEFDTVLEKTGLLTGADRSYIFLFENQFKTISNTNEWCRPGIEAQIQKLQQIPVKDLPWFVKQLFEQNTIYYTDIGDMPPEAHELQKELEEEQVKSILMVPMIQDGVTIGCMGFDSVTDNKIWFEEDIRLLKTSAEILSNAINRHKIKRKLLENQQMYYTLFELSPSGIILEDEKGMILDVNPAYCKFLGYKKEELIGQNISLVTHPEARSEITGHLGTLVLGEELRHVEKSIRKDGTTSFMLLHEKQIMLPNGNLGILCVADDISDRIDSEVALKDSEERYRILTENSPNGIVVHSKGRVVFVNPTAVRLIKAKSANDLLGKDIMTFIHPDYKEMVAKRVKAIFESAESILELAETRYLCMDGSDILVETSAQRINFNNEAASLVVFSDISERKAAAEENRRLQEQLQQIQKMEAIGTLAGGIAHDFNNILTIINGHAELAMLKINAEDVVLKDIQAIQNAGRRAQDLTSQILAFSRKQVYSPRVVNINEVITGMNKMLGRLISEDIRLNINLGNKIPNITADPGQLEQILMNLVINSRDAIEENRFSKKDKIITIKTAPKILKTKDLHEFSGANAGKYVRITVSDTGKGIDKTIINRIYEPFFTTKEVDRGTGLGLATVYGIVEQNDAFIAVDSKKEKGTTFDILWPVTDKGETIREKKLIENEEFKGSETILLVEDDDAVRSFTATALQNLGYTILEMSSGQETLEMLSDLVIPVDLLITDLVMPGISGQELAVEIQRVTALSNILFVSGYTYDHLLKNGALKEDINFIQKPFTIRDLARTVRGLLDSD